MKPIFGFIILFAIFGITAYAEPATKTNSIEVQLGVIGLQQSDGVLITPALTYLYAFNTNFRFGGYLGYSIQTYAFQPTFGAKLVFGDKANGFAVGLNIGMPPSIGLYYRNIYINFFYSFFPSDIGFVFDIGYSFDFWIQET